MPEINVRPGIFHLHIDGKALLPDVDALIKSRFGFVDGDFCGHPEGYRHFEPEYHRILKLTDRATFNRVFDELEFMMQMHDFTGYIEGEYIKSDAHITCGAFDDTIDVPFHVTRRLLRGVPDEPFREAELHLVMERDASDERFVRRLLDAGLYGAHIPKGSHVDLVLTAQGSVRDVDKLIPTLTAYIERAGGAVGCTIKNERAIRYAMFGIDHTGLPEIVDRVDYR